jgi:hypothetical protein
VTTAGLGLVCLAGVLDGLILIHSLEVVQRAESPNGSSRSRTPRSHPLRHKEWPARPGSFEFLDRMSFAPD